MRRNWNAQRLVVHREDGWTDAVVDPGSPDRGPHPWWGIWEFDSAHLAKRDRDALMAAGFVKIGEWVSFTEMIDEQWALHTPLLPVLALYLLAEHFIVALNWRLARLAWSLGLVEPHEALMFSWRHDFSPYPWRGRKRRCV